jgi:diguanylate cyclase (GGDEF)-like protein
MYQDASIFPVYDPSGIVQGACIAIQDATELAEAMRLLDRTMDQALDLEELNQRDGLTGLYNRKFFDEQINQELLSARRYNWPLALAMIDVDNFKEVNDQHGHVAGDTVLQGLATHLQGMLRSSDTLCRYGGEEFALILPQISPENSGALLERLRNMIQGMWFADGEGGKVAVTISIGVANLYDGLTAGELVARADDSLYQSKHAGRNRVTCYADPREMIE